MFVLILPSWYFERGTGQLTGKNFHTFASALRSRSVDARIVYPRLSAGASILIKESDAIEDNVPTSRITRWYPPIMHASLITSWAGQCAKEVLHYFSRNSKPDVIHAHSYRAALIAAEVQKESGIPFVFTEHLSSFLNDTVPEKYHDPIRKAGQAAHTITCVSPGLRTKLENYIDREIDVVPNFYNPEIFQPHPFTKPETFTWIAPGEPIDLKGTDLLIRAFGALARKRPGKNMQLIIFDEIRGKEKLMRLVKQSGIESHVHLPGIVSHPQLADFYHGAHCFISSSRVETFGTATAEAQACGLPVVASRTAGSVFILESEQQGVLVEAGSSVALLKGMEQMLDTYQQFDPHYISACMHERFAEERIISLWKEIYHKVT